MLGERRGAHRRSGKERPWGGSALLTSLCALLPRQPGAIVR
jgi:hypothetical protein